MTLPSENCAYDYHKHGGDLIPPLPKNDIQFWIEFAIKYGDPDMLSVLQSHCIPFVHIEPDDDDKPPYWEFHFPEAKVALLFNAGDILVEVKRSDIT